jgi:SAM-dependent methyltransferase
MSRPWSDRLVHAWQRFRGRRPSITPWRVTPEAARARLGDTEFERLFATHQGPLLLKWLHYLPLYERYLGGFAGRPLRMLEIGVAEGGSLALWRRRFGPGAVLFGVDNDPRCAALDGRDGQVRIGSQTDAAFLHAVVAEMGGLDVVLDDGSHVTSHQRAAFAVLFPLLAEGGVYMVEDLHTNYWRGMYEGGLRRRGSFIELAKRLVDDLHAPYHGGAEHPAAAGMVGGVHFHDSVVVIEKVLRAAPAHSAMG